MSNPNTNIADIVGIRFRPSDKMQYFDCAGIDLAVADRVLVETAEGVREGVIAIAPGQVAFSDLRGPMYSVVQKADE